MLRILVITAFFIAMLTVRSFGQFPVPTDSLYTLIKSNSIHRTTVDWQKVDQSFYQKLGQAKTMKDTMKCFVYVLEQLNDVHSQMYLDNQYYGHYPSFDDTTLARLKPMNDLANALTNQIYTKVLPGKTGYIRVPSIQAYDKKQVNIYAQSLYDSVVHLANKGVKGFIVDLRLNGGGNIYPMLSGLSLLLGNQVIAYETDIEDSVVRKWEIKNGNFVIGGYQATDIIVKPVTALQSMPVVVLTGPVTKSSGSMTAIAFKKRPKAILIGEPTADGYTTSNGYFQIAPNLMLNFATSFVADRAMIVYKTAVTPEILIYKGDDFNDLMQDKKIILALEWLGKASR